MVLPNAIYNFNMTLNVTCRFSSGFSFFSKSLRFRVNFTFWIWHKTNIPYKSIAKICNFYSFHFGCRHIFEPSSIKKLGYAFNQLLSLVGFIHLKNSMREKEAAESVLMDIIVGEGSLSQIHHVLQVFSLVTKVCFLSLYNLSNSLLLEVVTWAG